MYPENEARPCQGFSQVQIVLRNVHSASKFYQLALGTQYEDAKYSSWFASINYGKYVL